MKLEFLGTAAAEGFPDPFCECANCTAARAEGGPSLRKRSAAILNDEMLIDFGPDILSAVQQRGMSIAGLTLGLQTHPHSDHLEQGTFFDRKRMCQTIGTAHLDYYCSQTTVDRLDGLMRVEESQNSFTDPAIQDAYQMTIHVIEPWHDYDMGAYQLQTAKANHDAEHVQTMLHAIREKSTGKSLFYCTDTGNLPDGTWQRLADLGWTFDLIAIDFTFGFADRSSGHMNHEQVLEEVAKGREAGVITESTRIFATHLAHHSNPCHSETVERCAAFGIEVAHDGLVVTV